MYIDWNQEGDFLGSKENYVIVGGAGSTEIFGIGSVTSTVPEHAKFGPTRMRMKLIATEIPDWENFCDDQILLPMTLPILDL